MTDKRSALLVLKAGLTLVVLFVCYSMVSIGSQLYMIDDAVTSKTGAWLVVFGIFWSVVVLYFTWRVQLEAALRRYHRSR